jgi:hypothetical protein
LARDAGGYDELVCGDAAELPWKAETFDLAVAYPTRQTTLFVEKRLSPERSRSPGRIVSDC